MALGGYSQLCARGLLPAVVRDQTQVSSVQVQAPCTASPVFILASFIVNGLEAFNRANPRLLSLEIPQASADAIRAGRCLGRAGTQIQIGPTLCHGKPAPPARRAILRPSLTASQMPPGAAARHQRPAQLSEHQSQAGSSLLRPFQPFPPAAAGQPLPFLNPADAESGLSRLIPRGGPVPVPDQGGDQV